MSNVNYITKVEPHPRIEGGQIFTLNVLLYHDEKDFATISTIHCFGEWSDDSNCVIVGSWASGDEMEEIWAGDGWPHEEPPKDWSEVVNHLVGWACANNITIEELSSC